MIRRFNRYELKYVLTQREYLRIVNDLEGFLDHDRHAGAEGIYRIASLYYDSLDLSCYRNKIDGIKYRRKLRLRIYKDSDMSFGFVEIKQRINRTVQKRRLRLPIDEAKALCSGEDIGIDRFDTVDGQANLSYFHWQDDPTSPQSSYNLHTLPAPNRLGIFRYRSPA